MTYEEAKSLKTFKYYCTCGGYAANMNGRDKRHPHLDYCPQLEEFERWQAALEAGEPQNKKASA
jgi:hypothetical protein